MDLKAILAAHAEWVARGRTGDGRADLSCADLSGADLRRADLSGADLSGAALHGASLRGADLSEADLSWAGLSCANLSCADLSGADLSGVIGIRHTIHGGTWHGEAGRTLLCVEIGGEPRFFCGCFSGSRADLERYIADGPEKHRASRTRALRLCLEDMEGANG